MKKILSSIFLFFCSFYFQSWNDLIAQTHCYDFNNGAYGWSFAYTGKSHKWKWIADRGVGDSGCLFSDLEDETDFVASPALLLEEGKEYVVSYKTYVRNATPRKIYLGINDRLSVEGRSQLAVHNCGQSWTEQIVKISVRESGCYYLFFYLLEGGYKDTYIDDFCVEEEILPVVSIVSPVLGAQFNEGMDILLKATATDANGHIAKMEVFDNDKLLLSCDGGVVDYVWNNYVPGHHQLKFVATDNRGSRSESSIDILIYFSDGTLSDLIHWDFNGPSFPWTFKGGWCQDPQRGDGNSGGLWGHGLDRAENYCMSGRFFLYAGQTYRLRFMARSDGSNRTLSFLLNKEKEFGGQLIITQDLGAASKIFNLYEVDFTVDQDGGYFLFASWLTSGTGKSYEKIFIDDIRLSGNINAAPEGTLVQPATSNKVMEGAELKFLVEAADRDGAISRVDFFANGQLVGTATEAPYSCSWLVNGVQEQLVYAKAYDDKNADADSKSVKINVVSNTVLQSSYLGDLDNNSVRGAVVLSDGTVVLAANIGEYNPGGEQFNLLGATPAHGGVLIRLSPDGQTVLSTTRLASVVSDLATDAADNLYVAAVDQGFVKLNALASMVLWVKTFDKNVLRTDVSNRGYSVVLTSPVSDINEVKVGSATIHTFDPQSNTMGVFGGPSAFTTDVCIDESSATVVAIGWKNIHTWEGTATYPVDVSAYRGYAFDGTIKYNGYNWESQANEQRYINKPENNMADSRASRCRIAPDGTLYILFEVDGGNHIFRYSPLDIMSRVKIVGGDDYHQFHNTNTEPKIFLGKYNTPDGNYLLGQQFAARLSNGAGNTVRTKNGDLAIDGMGRVYITGSSAYGLPINLEMLPGAYLGGSFLMVLSPDFSTRDVVLRPTTGGSGHTLALAPSGKVVLGGSTNKNDLFLKNPFNDKFSGGDDGFLMMIDLEPFFDFKVSSGPRLYFDQQEVAVLREKIGRDPFKTMFGELLNIKDKNQWGVADYNPDDVYDLTVRIENYALLYVLTGDDAYAQEAAAMTAKVIRSQVVGYPWASNTLKGLTSYWMARRVAHAYDWCKNAQSWDNAFCFEVSSALLKMGNMIISHGGTEQNTASNSNWQGNRGASAGLCFLATDHHFDANLLQTAYSKVVSYIDINVTTNSNTSGWMPEGLGYTYYPMGNFVGPFGIAMARYDGARDIRRLNGISMVYWSMYATFSNALSLAAPPTGLNGIKPDMANDNPNTAGEGSYGQAFYYGKPELLPGMRFWYDRTQGDQSPYGAIWDRTRNGLLWSMLYYPESVEPGNPMEIPMWLQAFDDSKANGMQVFRNNYNDGNDHVVQFNAKLRHPGGHWGADGLSFRIIAQGAPFVVGGGRNNPANGLNQSLVYPSDPDGLITPNNNLSTILGQRFVANHGGGHIVARVDKNNVGTENHKRWFVADFNKDKTLADGVYVIADESSNGRYFQLPTYAGNNIAIIGNTFTISAPNGATMRGTVLYPSADARIVTGSKTRGSNYGEFGSNNYVHIQGSDGSFIVVLTVVGNGTHPPVERVGGTNGEVDGSVVRVGHKQFTFTADAVLYDAVDELPTSVEGIARHSRVWPVPSNGLVMVETLEPNCMVEVFNMQGVAVYQTIIDRDSASVDLSSLAKGNYLMTIKGSLTFETHRIVIR